MYIWTGAVLPKEFEEKIRNKCKIINKKYNVEETSFTLPQHVSLKTSFHSNDYDMVINYMKYNIFNKLNTEIDIVVDGIEHINGVIWLNIRENENLRTIHNTLNKGLQAKFNIPKIKFDGETFKFHSTLFQDQNNDEKLTMLYEELNSELTFPIKLCIKEINFGISENGKVGTYIVHDKLYLNK